ncbi:GntR family transcriptional regulator [Klebsiella pasteurii]|uniref:GntR family transcriptional regulator n=1 Tax=Klebsiella pasteurii TaxID=2587529 RepID=UPI0032DAC3D1
MSRSQNLRHNVINQVINDIARGFIPSPLPSQSALAEMYNISRTTVRHILSHLCERGVLSQVNQDYLILRLREMLETHALQHFLNLPDNDARWLYAKTLLERHRALRDSIGDSFRMFSQLDRDFHTLLLSAADNIFFNQSLEIISVIFHFHYQWDESDLKQRNIIAIDEHMTILSALICRSDLDANLALRNHLNSAKQSMINSLKQSESFFY